MMAKRWLASAGLIVCVVWAGGPAALASSAAGVGGPAGSLALVAAGAESNSWAGYYLSGGDGAFTSVSAKWTAPTATCVKGEQEAAFWVGLDGISSDSVEQIGTEADCTSGTASYFGWYEMYPAPPVDFSNVIEPGDALTASVTFSGTDTYTLVLTDSTQDWSHKVVDKESGLARSSAEVVTSGPGESGTLTNFGTVTYTGCTVDGISMGTQNPVKVTMVDAKGNVMVLPSTMTGAGKFTNTWERGT
jgi:peptidase A4-like protein